jgi:hypothetical protein
MSSYSPTIMIVSGGVGSSGEQLVNTVLAQYPDASVKVTILGNTRQPEQVSEALQHARSIGALVVHTLVDPFLHDQMVEQASELGVSVVDLTGDLMNWLTSALAQKPVGRPGLYRQTNRQYFERVEAIDYTLTHDDGKNMDGWPKADLFLVGVSRVGKTPLSVYLAVLGWKVANYPLVPQLPVPETLFALDPGRVFGLTVDISQLMMYRMQRQARLGVAGTSNYMNPDAVEDELREAKKIFRRGGFQILDMTDKTIEMAADEILHRITLSRDAK